MAAAVGACGGSSQGEPGQAGVNVLDQPRITPAVTLADLIAGPPASVAVPGDANVAGDSDYQRAILDDGEVTFDEYERATFDAIACMRAAGIIVYAPLDPERPGFRDGPALNKQGQYQYFPAPASENADYVQFEADKQRCDGEYTSTVSYAWLRGTSLTYEDLQAARDAIAECLREAGYEVPEHPSGADMMRLAFPPNGQPAPNQQPPADYLACSTPVSELLGFRRYLGQ